MNESKDEKMGEANDRRESAAPSAITTDAIASAALGVADKKGIHGVTIRAVAKAVGLAPMSLYTYFDAKEHLYDAMFGKVLEQAFERVGHSTWQLEIEAGCRQARTLLSDHPEWFPLLTRVTVPASSLPLYEHLLELTLADGMTPLETMFAVSSAISFTLGTVLVERMMGKPRGVEIPRQQLRLVRGLLPEGSPLVGPSMVDAVDTFETWSFDSVFEQGLRSLIAGIEHRKRSAHDA